MVNLGPLSPWEPRPLDLLTDEDRAWLDAMADVLPRTMPVDGSSWWQITHPDPAIMTRGTRW
jgi:hypothetical protein